MRFTNNGAGLGGTRRLELIGTGEQVGTQGAEGVRIAVTIVVISIDPSEE